MAVELSLGEHVGLAVLARGAGHGWVIVRELDPDGELGRIWSMTNPNVYRAIDQLVDKGLVRRGEREAGRGPGRTMLSLTAAGKRAVRRWLDQPVDHLRDVRTELLLKLVLRRRLGLPDAPFVAAQQAALAGRVDSLLGPGHAGDDVVDGWRREHARAVQRFLATLARPTVPGPDRPELRLSARNQLAGVVTAVVLGEVMATVKAVLPDGQSLTAAVTREAVEELGFAPGDPVVVIVKSTEVLLAKP